MTERSTRLKTALAVMHEPLAGELCLDFANTIEPRGGPPPIEKPQDVDFRDEITSYDELVAWALHKHSLTDALAEALLEAGDNNPARTEAVVESARHLRDVIYRVFWSIANQQLAEVGDLASISRAHAEAAAHAKLIMSPTGVDWVWATDEVILERPLWPIAWSAATLLTTADHRRIKVCPGPGRPPVRCSWLFYDSSKNGSRRWCSMADCGSAVKTMHQTARRRTRRSSSTP